MSMLSIGGLKSLCLAASHATAMISFPSRMIRHPVVLLQESWRESDTTTIMGRKRSATTDAGIVGDDDYCVLDLEVSTRAAEVVTARRSALDASMSKDFSELALEGAAELVARAQWLQSARRSDEAERCFVMALAQDRKCGAAWYGLGALLHEHQHGGLANDAARDNAADGKDVEQHRLSRLSQAADLALVAARFEAAHPRALALLGDALNDQGEYQEACRAWRAAEVRGRARWRALTVGQPPGAFGAREPLRSLRVGESTKMRRTSGHTFAARRLAMRPAVFVLEGFSTAKERQAIEAAAIAAPLREVPLADEGDEDDDRRGCEVAWLPSPCTEPSSPWAALMRDATDVVLPRHGGAGGGAQSGDDVLPSAAEAEDLHVVRYSPGGSYGLHLDATFAVPRAVTVLHYLNDVPPDAARGPGFGGETWLPHATTDDSAPSSLGATERPLPGRDGVLVPPRAGDALVFFSFDEHGEVEPASLHGGRPANALKLIANQWIRLDVSDPSGVVPRGPGFGPRVIS